MIEFYAKKYKDILGDEDIDAQEAVEDILTSNLAKKDPAKYAKKNEIDVEIITEILTAKENIGRSDQP